PDVRRDQRNRHGDPRGPRRGGRGRARVTEQRVDRTRTRSRSSSMDENRYITLRPNTKIPDTPRWNRVNRAQAAEHVARGGNIALATGEPSGLFVLDIDVKDGVDGRETLRRCQEVYGLLPLTRTVFTPSGGTHFYFRIPPGFHHTTSASRLGRGIDTRCN